MQQCFRKKSLSGKRRVGIGKQFNIAIALEQLAKEESAKESGNRVANRNFA